ncbi:MAG: hypothetical protein UHD09_01780 [Bifidobacterium sp.]|nr:hypothetical protein [Bifidobacterium sp.]
MEGDGAPMTLSGASRPAFMDHPGFRRHTKGVATVAASVLATLAIVMALGVATIAERDLRIGELETQLGQQIERIEER